MALFLASLPARRILRYLGALGLLAAIGLLDLYSGGELSFSIFYLVPVGLVAWYDGRLGGVLLALLAAGVWLSADASWQNYSHPTVAAWNAVVRLGFFALVALGLARIRSLLERERLQARRDLLTGAANSRQFFELLNREAARSRRSGRPLTVAYLDLDGFKQVNDQLGHLAGDRVLQEVASVLTRSLRVNDVTARLGGDEFALLLPETALAEARVALERLQLAIAESMRDNAWPVTASIGAATFLTVPRTTQEMVQRADELMYRAKREGKDALCIEVVGRPSTTQADSAAAR